MVLQIAQSMLGKKKAERHQLVVLEEFLVRYSLLTPIAHIGATTTVAVDDHGLQLFESTAKDL